MTTMEILNYYIWFSFVGILVNKLHACCYYHRMNSWRPGRFRNWRTPRRICKTTRTCEDPWFTVQGKGDFDASFFGTTLIHGFVALWEEMAWRLEKKFKQAQLLSDFLHIFFEFQGQGSGSIGRLLADFPSPHELLCTRTAFCSL